MIPREIDELMWTIAESNDPAAVEDFGNRYPNLREEMLKRMRTIRALKSGSRLPRSTSVPTFQNTQTRPPNWRWTAGSFAIAILAISAFGIWKAIPKSEQLPPVQPINTAPSELPKALVQTNAIQSDTHIKKPVPIDNPSGNNQSSPNSNIGSTLPKPPVLSSMQLESATLNDAIQLIAAQGNLTVTIAPGMPNPTIKVNYQTMAPMDMLKDLGQTYAFTTVLDGEHAIIIIPKKDEDEGQISGINR